MCLYTNLKAIIMPDEINKDSLGASNTVKIQLSRISFKRFSSHWFII